MLLLIAYDAKHHHYDVSAALGARTKLYSPKNDSAVPEERCLIQAIKQGYMSAQEVQNLRFFV